MSVAVVSMPVQAPPPPKAAGISVRTTYSAEVEDLKKLIAAVHEGKAPVEAIMANGPFLQAQARAFKRVGPLYPGVVCSANRGLAAGRG